MKKIVPIVLAVNSVFLLGIIGGVFFGYRYITNPETQEKLIKEIGEKVLGGINIPKVPSFSGGAIVPDTKAGQAAGQGSLIPNMSVPRF